MNLAMTITLADHVKVKDVTIERKISTDLYMLDQNMNRHFIRDPRPEVTVNFLVSRQHLSLLKKQAEKKKLEVMVDNIPAVYTKLSGDGGEIVIGYLYMDVFVLHVERYHEDGDVSVTVEGVNMELSIVSRDK